MALEPRSPKEASPATEEGARSALLVWGGGLLVAGIALVGVGAGAEGAPLALAGLFNTIYGIHTFGRLGEDERAGDPDEDGPAARAKRRAESMAWTGGLAALAGLLVAVDHQGGWQDGHPTLRGEVGAWAITAYGLVALGLARVAQARKEATAPATAGAPRGAPVKAKVEKRRGMDKSPAP